MKLFSYYGSDSQDIGFKQPVHVSTEQRYFWILDPGHGAKTAGKRSPVDSEGRQLLEYQYNQDIVHHISEALKADNIEHLITVPNPENFGNALKYRVSKANEYHTNLPKIFVSVHGNAGPVKGFSNAFGGIETFFYSATGRRIAEVFQNHLTKKLKLRDRGVKRGERLYVLAKTDHPAILTETGFYNNPDEFEKMMNPNFRKLVAEAHLRALREIEKHGI
jgi:N-acetylmuramoyl-L-alanine amidase